MLSEIASGPIFFQLVSNAVFFASSIYQIGMVSSRIVCIYKMKILIEIFPL